ncbi:MAG: magnesium transporter [Lachnospiraceae bacterium]|nr:magnesium transporter [Candidatus Hippenecus merdae]
MSDRVVRVEDTIEKLLAEKKYPVLKEVLRTMNGADVAAVFNELDPVVLPLLFRVLPKDTAADCFVEMEPEVQEKLIKGLSDTELREIVNDLFVDDAADIVEEMPASVVKRILAQADPQMRKEINEVLKYPENSAGSIMTTEFVALKPEMTIRDALNVIRKTGVDKETIYTCYVTEKGVLIGFVSVKDLILAPSDDIQIRTLMTENVISVGVKEDQEQVAEMFKKYNFLAMPVVDSENRMVGIITVDDVMDVMEDETTEDMQIMAGMMPSDKVYLRSKPVELFKSRIPWLLILMISSTFTSLIIDKFEAALAAQVVLTAFIPMLMGTGGNSGSQSSVTVIRAISLGEVEWGDLPAIIWKEGRTAFLCGLALAGACFIKLMLLDGLLLGNDGVNAKVALVVSLAMLFTVILAKSIGCILPMVAKKLNFDPAVMASPFITTIVDALSLLVYFGIASAILF